MKTDEELLTELKQATSGLMFMSESDYPFEILHWTGLDEVTLEFLRGLTSEETDVSVQIESLDDFFRTAASEPNWKKKEELNVARKYQALLRMLKANLEDIRVYKVGKINMPVYIVGRSASGNRLGISTRVVET